MKFSESVTKIAPALLAAQRLMGAAKKGAANPYFKSKYADLGAVLEACKELLNDHGVVILQPHYTNALGVKFVETILLHESGEWVSSETEIVVAKANDPQAQGSAITYARRYGLQSLLSMPAEDDDGEGAMSRNYKAKTETKAVSTPVETKTETPATTTPTGNVTNIATAPKSSGGFKPPKSSKPAEAPAPAAATGSEDNSGGWT